MAVPCLWFAGTTYAQQTWQTEAEMRVVATDFLHQQFGDDYKLNLKFGNLDDRLRLDKCQQPLRAFLPSNRAPLGAVSLGIRCTQPVWKIHLPVKVRAYTNVLVASRPIVKNSIIKRQDLQFVHQDISRYYAGVFTNPKDLVGMVAKRSIRHDAVITGRMVEPKRLVKRGDMVTIIAKTGSLQIRTKGEALSDGHQGQVIQVKNHRSGRQVSAEVIAQSTVRVKL
ncbi:MAG: flagellar basal body P-ring formation chaperone FlgA [Thioalkalispiraceae bacterium]